MPHTLRIRVSGDDIDELGHASNLVYLRWVQEAAIDHSRAVGLGVAEYLARGTAFVVRRHEIEYLRPALVGDEIDVSTWVASLGAATSERRTAIRRVGDGALLARAVTQWVHLDLSRGRPVRTPEAVRGRFTIEDVDGEGA
jgi:acyl-CoA thioester hydrolase